MYECGVSNRTTIPVSKIEPVLERIEHFLKRQDSSSSPHILLAMLFERVPDILITEIPPLPGAVAGAIMVLLDNLRSNGPSGVPPLLKDLNKHIHQPIKH